MLIRLLCPGPSLKHYQPADFAPADLTIGVNAAATAFACDVWVAGDVPFIERTWKSVIGSPLLVTSTNTQDTLRDRNKKGASELWPGRFECWTVALGYCQPAHPHNWPMFSATAALIYSGYRGAQTIDVYGADMAGPTYFDGREDALNCRESRWKCERDIWAAVVEVLRSKGTQVIRHEPRRRNEG